MFHVIPRQVILQNALRVSSRAFSANQGSSGSSQPPIKADVPGLTEDCVKIRPGLAPPIAGKDKDYKCPEYFGYDKDSFGQAEVEIAKYRLPPPSNKQPFNR